jgi:ribosome modulation factor
MIETRKRNLLLTGATLAVLALLQGCATLDKDECMLADWRLIGYQDGVAGKSATVVGEYREDCAKHAVVPDLDAYRAGREEGLQQYCKADNGYRLGNAGRGHSAVCPTALEGDFRDAYNAGRKLYLARSAVNKTSSHLNNRKQALSTLEKNRAQKLAALIADGLKADQRVMILYDINELQQEMDSIEEEIAGLELDLEDQQARLDHLSHNSTY